MTIEIEPEPSAEERAAIAAALETALLDEGNARPGPWWAAGLRDGVADVEDEL